jgi:hypothetical protein
MEKPEQRRLKNRDQQLFEALKKAYDDGDIHVATNFSILNQPGSPVYSAFDNIMPLLIMVIASLGIMLLFKLIVGIFVMIGAVLVHLFAVRPFVAHHMHNRLVEILFASPDHWKAMWKYGGFTIGVHDKDNALCVAPSGDWRVFADKHLKVAPPTSLIPSFTPKDE